MSLARGATLTFASFLTVAFAANAQQFELVKVEANPAKGFQWPYYLTVPSSVKTPTVLLVAPNNTGKSSDDQNVHDKAALELIVFMATWSRPALGSPILVPTFPRLASHALIYTHSLDRATLLTRLPGLERIDLQLIAMIEDARAKLATRGIVIEQKVWMEGFSASGSFVSGFVHLHPEIVKAASPGGAATLPVAEWKGQVLEYPWGIADLKYLVGQEFNLDAFRQVAIQIYVGDQDPNMQLNPAADPAQALIADLFGDWFNAYPVYEAVYRSVGSPAEFTILPGYAHGTPLLPYAFYLDFFERNRTEPVPPARPKPMLYTLYFPHLACTGGWDTEISLVYTLEGTPVNGELRAYGTAGGVPVQTMAMTLPPAVRRQIDACREFANSSSPAYLAFASDSGFVAGSAKFSRQGSAASIGAVEASRSGVFPKMERQGWTNIVLLNADTAAATVTLSAIDDNGFEVATTSLKLEPGARIAGAPDAIFKSAVQNASYIRFTADKYLIGVALYGSADGRILDGLPALPEYAR